MAAELVGGALLSAFLQVAFDRLASPDILDFFRKRRLNETLLNKLNIMLLSINAVVDDAEQKQISNPNVKAWLDRVRDAVYDAEDVLDEVDYEVTKRNVEAELQTSASSKVRTFFSASVSSFAKEIGTRMKEVLENLEYLASQKDILKLEEGRSGAVLRSAVSERLPTTSLVDEAEINGRDDDKEMIVEWLLSDNDNSQLRIISIVGMGGLGKTTLAQHIYNDQRMEDQFNLKAWVCVSDDFDVLRVTRTIFNAITMSNDDTKDLNMLQIKLKQLLTGKRFFLVLDDVWSENFMLWDALQKPLSHGAAGSKILVTTRSEKVASTMRSTKIHPLKQLSEEDSWSLFRRYAFHNVDTRHSNSDLEGIGKKIMKRCKGLPLALKMIGSLLYTKLSYEEWNDILESGIWEEKTYIPPALRLSYHYLPSPLKRCFAYCSLFPKDYEFDKEHLIQLWMAENFLQCTHQTKDIMEVGGQFFHDLLSRSLFQRSISNEMRFVMHDLVNDLAKDESGKFCHRLEVDEANNMIKMTRHVSYLRKLHETPRRFDVMCQVNRLRTFLSLSVHPVERLIENGCLGHMMSSKMLNYILSRFKCLRILSLSGYVNIVELPDSIGYFKHLRYLDLSGTRVRRLPDSVCLLYNLQTLKLRYCWFLEKLPSDLHKLTNLRHLDFRKTQVREMPEQLEKLKNLQVLSSFYVGKCNDTDIKQLKEFNLRGTISILELQNVMNPLDALAVNLKNKIYLEGLRLEWTMNNDKSHYDKDVLENLQPHLNLKKLSICNYGSIGFPDWLLDLSLSNIVSLKLRNCRYCLSLPSFALLPSLKSLSIKGLDSIVAVGPEFHGNGSCTTSLEVLKFECMKEWEEWNCDASIAFPRLQEFFIVRCPKLRGKLPAKLPSLRKLGVEFCEQLVASIPWAPSLDELIVKNSGKMQLESLSSTPKVLHIGGCFTEISSTEIIENTMANTCLEELHISDCGNLELPLSSSHNFLCKLKIKGSCDSLRTFPLDLFPKLQSLEVVECSNLEMISFSKENCHCLPSLTVLTILRCPKFVSFPKGGIWAPKLAYLLVSDLESLESLPESVGNLRSLQIKNCPKLMAARMEWHLHRHTSLYCLTITDKVVECLPDLGLLPPTLTDLGFWSCSNLRTLDYKGLCHLSALNHLTLSNCPKLQCLPKEGLPSSLYFLSIERCPLLSKRCQKQRGKDWAKIAHIPCVSIDDDILT